ncbi:hypothetical protein [Hyphomicrobium sp. D-2]|uniref:hypothetical protein n=1 Tax=Hyphomicrobium sp. D-2 TaxID=3041621 RepID=UPI002458B1E9|nr:hypothetical protein [Hyphomicrobium sp. D-2]MDH4981789.1 hypothetical protein [Hyphomicrobium sp. D-2]
MRTVFSVAFVFFAAASIAQAATLQPQQGRVTLNGSAVVVPTTVRTGDLVWAGAESSAQIVYANGCTVTVSAGTNVTVPAPSACQGTDMTNLLLGGGLVAGAVTAAIVLSNNSSDKPASP